MDNRDNGLATEKAPAPRTYCAFCGKNIIPNAQFCSFCGKEQIMPSHHQPIQAIPVSIVKQPVDKAAKRRRVFLALEIVFAALSFISLLFICLLKFKTNSIKIYFYSGAEKTVIRHDLLSCRLWFIGLILGLIFMLTTIILVIMQIKLSSTISKSSAIIIVLSAFVLLPMLSFNLIKLSDRRKDYSLLKTLDKKRATKGFVSYDPDYD